MSTTESAIATVLAAKAHTVQPIDQPLDNHRLYGVNDVADRAGLSRGMIYRAMSDDPVKRNGLPYLASLTVGNARRIRGRVYRAWVDALEASSGE